MLKIATLFSGIGTPEQSLKHLQVEHETIFACEIDKYARITYLANNKTPKTFYDDVYNIDGNKYKNQIDILIGGSPCQSFSIAGKRMGTSCPRGNLIYEYFRIVEESQPKVFIYENVKGFLSIDKGETFKNFVQSFKDSGYTTYHKVLNTKDYLVPQNRERIYIVGFKDNVDFHFQEKQELKLRLKDMLEDEVDKKYHLSQEAISYMGRERQGKPRWEFHKNEVEGIAACLTANMHKGVPYGVITPYLPIRLEQTHTLNIKGNDSIKRIYSSDGHNPSLTTMQGGHREPKIAHPVREVGRRLDENGKRCDNNKDIPITRRYEIGEKEISNCLSGVQKDSYVAIANGVIEIENDEVRVKEATKYGYKVAEEGDSINISVPSSKTRRGRVGKQVAQTLDTACNQVVFNKINKLDTNLQSGYNGVNKKELEYEKSTLNQENIIKILRILWGEAREKAFKEWGFGINDSFQQEEILQQRLHGKEFCENGGKQSGLFIGSFLGETDKQAFYRKRFLPTMWNSWKSGCSSYRRGLSEQQRRQFDDFMQKLSHENSQTKTNMQSGKLPNESKRAWILRKALSKVQEVGRSYENKKTKKCNYIFRKLTERECFRLQGFDDNFIFPPKMSSTQLYKQAGNGMSRNILDMIFTQIFTCYAKHVENIKE